MTQCFRILEYIRKYGVITQLRGFTHLGITCTSQRITDLRKRGYDIRTRYSTNKTGARYAVWYLGTKRKAKQT
jgi:hypothetical protein